MSRNAWTPAEDALLATLPVTEVLRRTGRSMPSIVARRVILKKRGVSIADQRTSAEKLKVGRSVWTPEADEQVRRHRPIVVARKLGVSSATVQRRRKVLGLPPVGRKFMPPKPPPKYRLRRWTKAELRIALTLPPRKAVQLLPGRTVSAIDAVRCQRKRNGMRFKAQWGRPRKTA